MPEPLDLDNLNLDLQNQDQQQIQTNPNSQEFSDFASGVLSEFPEDEREIAAKYLKVWDGKVTQLTQKYSPYAQLGDYEDVQNAVDWVKAINEDPLTFFRNFEQALKEAEVMPEEFQIEPGKGTDSGIPKEFMDKFTAMEEKLASFDEFQSEQTASKLEQEQAKELDALLKKMHNEFGEFDDSYVIIQLAQGDCDEKQAVERFHETVKKYSSPKVPPPPKIFTGSGSTPQDQVARPTNKAERMAIVTQALEAARG